MSLEGIIKMFTRLSAIYKSASSSRVHRTAMPSALAILCVGIFVAGAVLIGHNQSLTRNDSVKERSVRDTRSGLKPPGHASSQVQRAAERSADPVNQGSLKSAVSGSIKKENSRPADTSHLEESAAAVISESATNSTATTRRDGDGDANKSSAPRVDPSKRAVGLDVPPVFSIMRTDEVRKKLSDATKPRTGTELSDAASAEADQEEARERKERAAKRMLAVSGALKNGERSSNPAETERAKFAARAGTSSPEARSNTDAQDQVGEPSPDTVATTYDLEKVKPSEFNGDVRDLKPVPINLAQRELDFDGLIQYPATPIGPPSPETKVPIVAAAPMPSPIRNFDGLSRTESVTGGIAGAGFPPDTNGDVGLNHYIISVNDAYGIYDKVTGARVAAFTENSLFSGGPTGTLCDTNSFGDPVVVYDQLADRWILTNFAFIANGSTGLWNPPLYQCFAVSKTSNPVTGGWWLYAVQMDQAPVPSNTLPDYGKFGNWNDGCLYMGANGFSGSTGSFVGNIFASFRKSDMESGLPLTASIGFSNLGSSLFPSNLLGKQAGQLPPAGTPNYFVRNSSTTGFQVRTFTPGANCGGGGTMSAATTVSHASGTTAGQNVVPQPNDTTHALDSLSDRIMQKVQYRKVGTAESLWAIHTVQPSGAPTAPQWAQINVTGGTIATTPVQQQIFAPDASLYRWMGSVAADSQGNMAIGYATSNGTSPNFPSIAYAGRLVGDPLNQLPQTETQLVAGGGSQVNNCGSGPCHRWGDYSSMSIDPTDDCTFWYSQEYYDTQTSGTSGNWHTRIGSFKFPGCTSGCATVTGTVSGGGTICTGSSSTVAVDVTGGTSPYTVKLTNNSEVQTGSAGQTHFVFTVSPTTTTIYQLDTASSHDNGSCPLTNSGSATVTVNQPPTPATVGSNQTICALGTTAGLGGNTPASGTGTWTVVSGGAGTFSNIHTPNATFTHTSGTGPVVLRWTISNPPCTDSTAQVTITINAQPTATTGGAQAICANGTTAGLGGNTPPVGMTGTWSVLSGGTGTFSDANAPNATFKHISGTGPITLRWTVANPPCPSAKADVTITINQPPATPTITPNPALVCAGSTGNLASAPVAIGYTWAITNGTITSLNNIQAITYTAGGSGSVTLNLTVTNASGCGASNSLMVTIKPIALDLDHESFAGNGGTGTVNVTPSDGACAWTASTTATFIHITSGSSGAGNGAVQYSVDVNPGPNIRSDTIKIGGQTFTVYQGIDFLDVPSNDPFYTDIGKLAARGVTLGCGSGNYCPNAPVTREQMAAFILRAIGEFDPPTPPSQRFNDVPPGNPFYNSIDRLAVLNITVGCTPDHLFYCPVDPVKRDQMSAFILRGLGEFNPPTPGSQRFLDVPPSNVFYNFIDRMAVLNITLGCTPDHLMYCPSDSVTRAQMAAFLVRAFNL
jgi:S-layer family protein